MAATFVGRPFVRPVLAAAVATLLSACATPTESFFARAGALGFDVEVQAGTRLRHVVVASAPVADGPVHIYIDHDGLPWRRVDAVSPDPTPRHPLALELMARDTGERIYVGRPCYFGLGGDAGCGAEMWTSRRYADEVVRSLAAVIERRRRADGWPRPVVLIGVSGGGTLAWLAAHHLAAVDAVVTVVGSLDVAAWARWHGYSPLAGSRDPAREPALPPSVRQVHFVGGRDTVVPAALTRAFVARQPNARVVEVPGFDHVCCWLERWPALLAEALRP
jgi:pimeloyl-ACP methyl ester carboxylesterase